ncbi:MAG: ATP-binding protein [Actinomycetaceae bacterium]|nr:ATP-binding protein [Actinomycetaceae bacterium]MDU0970876.1 ATP-binding protein [Actinomycetaceae bacterium]
MDRDALIVGIVATIGIIVGLWRIIPWLRERSTQRAIEAEGPPLSPRVQSLLRALPGITIVVDAANTVARADVAALAMGLVRDTRISSQPLLDALEAFRNDEEGAKNCEIEAPRRSGSGDAHVILDVEFAQLTDDYIVIIARDVTAQHRVESVRRRFIADASHELKTPVGAVALLAETIEDSADDPEAVRHFAASLRKESQRLSRLVNDIIELSRVQEPAPLATATVQPLGPILGAALARIQTPAAAAGLTVHAQGVADCPDLVLASESLEGAFANLLDNAVRYSEPGGTITVSIGHVDDRVTVAIADQGIGIDPAEQQAIFARFYRVDPARSRASGGTGLGLSIVKHVIADHRGTIRVDSALGEGATFTVSLPLAHSLQPTPGESDQ